MHPNNTMSILHSMVSKNKSFNRERWLSSALEVVASEGRGKLKIEYLCKRLGVTKGSFYSHFQTKRDFNVSVAKFWATTFTDSVIALLSTDESSPQEKLLKLMVEIRKKRLNQYDMVMRAWALDDPLIAEQVEVVDENRFLFVKSLFTEMGFDEDEAEMRTTVFQAYHSANNIIYSASFKAVKDKHELLRHSFFSDISDVKEK